MTHSALPACCDERPASPYLRHDAIASALAVSLRQSIDLERLEALIAATVRTAFAYERARRRAFP